NLTTRYDFPIMGLAGHLQGSVQAQSSAWDDLRILGGVPPAAVTGLVPVRGMLGKQPGYAQVDFRTGADSDYWSVEFFIQNVFDERAQQYRYAECVTQVCDNQTYVVPSRPRLIGIKFGQKF